MPEGWRRVDGFAHDLSLAVQLTDGVVGGRPVGTPTVRIDGVDEVPVTNRSGYRLFFELPPTDVTVRVDGGPRYQNASRTVSVDPSDSSYDPGTAAEFVLEPTIRYAFPAGLTRVRGRVLENGQPVADAVVSVQGFTRSIRTTADGEFVYYFDEIDHTDVVRSGGHLSVKPGNAHPVFTVTWSTGGFTQPVPVRAGRLTTTELTA